MLEDKLKKGLKMTGQYIGDDDSGLEVDQDTMEMEEAIDPEKLRINLKVIPIRIGFFCQFSLK